MVPVTVPVAEEDTGYNLFEPAAPLLTVFEPPVNVQAATVGLMLFRAKLSTTRLSDPAAPLVITKPTLITPPDNGQAAIEAVNAWVVLAAADKLNVSAVHGVPLRSYTITSTVPVAAPPELRFKVTLLVPVSAAAVAKPIL